MSSSGASSSGEAIMGVPVVGMVTEHDFASLRNTRDRLDPHVFAPCASS
ncbi:MAG: hypothetical protein ACYCV7_02935 [Acidimicrobiales bacterium]